MKLSQDIRDQEAAKAGMAQKSQEFNDMGGEIYIEQNPKQIST